MPEKSIEQNEMDRASLLSPEQLYRKGGYKKAVLLRRSFRDYENHLFAFLIDLNICLLPVYIWAVVFILILTGVIPPVYFDLLFYLMYGLLFLTSCVVLPLFTASTRGQTFGMRMLGLRLVKRDRKPANAMALVLNELIGTGAPLVIFGYFFSVFGLLAYWAINMLVILISPHQQSIADWMFNLVLVYMPEVKAKTAEAPVEEAPAAAPVQAPDKQSAASPDSSQSLAQALEEQKSAQPAAKAVVSPIDLHIRSNYSDDGCTDVEEIMQMAKKNNMEVISITDHNCARANFQAVRFAPMYDVQYIPGVEIDAQVDGHRVRLLGYYIDWNKPVFEEIEQESLKREKEASIQRVKAFEKLMGIRVDIDSILSRSRFQTITPSDLTQMVFHNQRTRKLPLIQQALKQTNNDEDAAKELFKEQFFGPGGECEVKETYPEASRILQEIHDANGLAVLSGWNLEDLPDESIEKLLDNGLDGVEAFNPLLTPAEKTFLLSLASSEKLFITAGSDYHGKTKPDREFGVTTCPAKGLNAVQIFTRALDAES